MNRRITIDGDLCQGTGECAALASQTVTFDPLGIAVVQPPGEVDESLADRLVRTCPSGAISAEST